MFGYQWISRIIREIKGENKTMLKLEIAGQEATEQKLKFKLSVSDKRDGALLLHLVDATGGFAGGVLRILPNGTLERVQMRPENREAFKTDSKRRIKLAGPNEAV